MIIWVFWRWAYPNSNWLSYIIIMFPVFSHWIIVLVHCASPIFRLRLLHGRLTLYEALTVRRSWAQSRNKQRWDWMKSKPFEAHQLANLFDHYDIYIIIYILAIQFLGCTPVLTCTGNTAKKMEVFNIRVTCDFEALGPTWSLAAQSLKCAAQRRLNEICSSPSVHNIIPRENQRTTSTWHW